MSTYLQRVQADVDFGSRSEEDVHQAIDSFFGMESEITSKWVRYDYIDKLKKIVIELKSRRVKKDRYYDTCLGYNKIQYYRRKVSEGYKVYLCFNFTDGLYYYPYDGKTDPNWIRELTCYSRGKPETKKHYFIPCHILKRCHADYRENQNAETNTEGCSNPLEALQEETPQNEE